MNKLPEVVQGSSLWNLIQTVINPVNYLEYCAKVYGDIYTIKLMGLPTTIAISNPQIIQEIFNLDAKQFDSGKGNDILRPLLGNESLILLDGDRHKRQRKLLMPPFHGERLQTYSKLICQIAEKVANQWEINQPFIARISMQDITLDVIIQAVFGLREGERYQQLKPLLSTFFDLIGSPLKATLIFIKILQKDWGKRSPWGNFIRCRQKIYDLLQAEIDQRRSQSQETRDDILSLMLSARDENNEAMTDGEIKDELMTLLLAGHETTATSLAWALYWIHKLPEVREKLLAEIDSLGENSDLMAITKLPYLNAVCQETLRIYPVALFTFPRISKTPIKLGGYEFDESVYLSPCIYSVHQREDLYPNPKQFKPERFLERQYSPSEYLPFGGGNRRCLGYALAQLEMKLVLATILSNYELVLADNKPVKPQRRGITLAPAGGVKMLMLGKRVHPSQSAKNFVTV